MLEKNINFKKNKQIEDIRNPKMTPTFLTDYMTQKVKEKPKYHLPGYQNTMMQHYFSEMKTFMFFTKSSTESFYVKK